MESLTCFLAVPPKTTNKVYRPHRQRKLKRKKISVKQRIANQINTYIDNPPSIETMKSVSNRSALATPETDSVFLPVLLASIPKASIDLITNSITITTTDNYIYEDTSICSETNFFLEEDDIEIDSDYVPEHTIDPTAAQPSSTISTNTDHYTNNDTEDNDNSDNNDNNNNTDVCNFIYEQYDNDNLIIPETTPPPSPPSPPPPIPTKNHKDTWSDMQILKEIQKLCQSYLDNSEQQEQQKNKSTFHGFDCASSISKCVPFQDGLVRLSKTSMLVAQFGLVTGFLCCKRPFHLRHLSPQFLQLKPGHLFQTRPQKYEPKSLDFWCKLISMFSENGNKMNEIFSLRNNTNHKSNTNNMNSSYYIEGTFGEIKKLLKPFIKQQKKSKRFLKILIAKLRKTWKIENKILFNQTIAILLDWFYTYCYTTDDHDDMEIQQEELIQIDSDGKVLLDISDFTKTWWEKSVHHSITAKTANIILSR